MNESISVFDMLKIGVGPSSSHTLGPWRAIQRWLAEHLSQARPQRIEVVLYGSLALTGRGHCTDLAIGLALLGHDPETVDIDRLQELLGELRERGRITLPNGHELAFDPATDIRFQPGDSLPGHPNGMCCRAQIDGTWHEAIYYSVGGGFVVAEQDHAPRAEPVQLPYPCQRASELLAHCRTHHLSIAEMVRANERCWRRDAEIDAQLDRIWTVMSETMFRGCRRDGILPGGLRVVRRAAQMNRQLLGEGPAQDMETPRQWIEAIRARRAGFADSMRWISCFALAVNEENASLGRVVTAPTNGAAGVIPAVLMFHLCSAPEPVDAAGIRNFLMVAGELGTHFKKGATISAAAGGCQAEIGVSSAMAAAALTEALGGSVPQSVMAAEIAMEHHLGMTCDPVNGLVQIPCIERNAMGAVKAINAAQLALARDPADARVSLDDVIHAMAETARDMNSKYKETSLGGLAVNIAVNHPEC